MSEATTTHGRSTFPSTGAVTIFEQWWRPVGEPRAVLAICHGYAEHSSRYEHVAQHLAAHRYAVEALDLRGHGHSSGERVEIRGYDEYHDDLGLFLDRVRGRNTGRKLFLLGHSMGGGVVTSFVLARRPELDGLLLSGAGMLGPRPLPDPNAPPPAPLPASSVSRDPAVVAAYESDPLIYHGPPKPNRLAASQAAYDLVQREMHTISSPLLIMHGTGDLLVPYRGSEVLYERAISTDKTLKLYDGLYHEILNEPERLTVLADIVGWLEARTGS